MIVLQMRGSIPITLNVGAQRQTASSLNAGSAAVADIVLQQANDSSQATS